MQLAQETLSIFFGDLRLLFESGVRPRVPANSFTIFHLEKPAAQVNVEFSIHSQGRDAWQQ